MRPAFESIYLTMASHLAQRSTCSRLKVGTVITSLDYRKVLAVGYNGNASGLANCCDRQDPGNCGCLHSEENAIINCDVSRDVRKIAFITHAPCELCAKRLINLGNVEQVFYRDDYRSCAGIQLLNRVGIATMRLSEEPSILIEDCEPRS